MRNLSEPLNGGYALPYTGLEVRHLSVDPKSILEQAIDALENGYYIRARGLCRIAIDQLEDKS